MSRELTEKLLKAFTDTDDFKMSYRELAAITAKEIERLLADERDRGAGFIVDLTKKYDALLATEREKVREKCASEVEKREGEFRDLLKTIEESCGPASIDAETERVRLENRADELALVAAGIRQLNLTKLDEDKKEKK